MEINQEKIDNYIKRITEIAQSIKNIYDQLSKATNNPEKTKELEEYLKLAISVEDKVYKEIGEKLFYSDRFLKRTSYLINHSDLKDKDAIYNRILMYATQMIFLNPYPSTEYSNAERNNENIATIKCQICMEYIRNTLVNTQREIEKTSSKNEKKRLTTSKNTTLFNNKVMSNLIGNERYCNSSARKRCIEFKQDEEIVNTLFMEYAASIINYSLNCILLGKNTIFNQIELRSALELLKENELFQVARNYQGILDTNPDYKQLPTSQIITDIIREVMEEKETKKKKKKR